MQKDKSIDASAAEDLDDDAIEKFANKQAFVVVLGDIGRSPRMCNHAVSLAAAGFDVTFVGYGGSNLSQQVRHSHKIEISTKQRLRTDSPQFNMFTTLFLMEHLLLDPSIRCSKRQGFYSVSKYIPIQQFTRYKHRNVGYKASLNAYHHVIVTI